MPDVLMPRVTTNVIIILRSPYTNLAFSSQLRESYICISKIVGSSFCRFLSLLKEERGKW